MSKLLKALSVASLSVAAASVFAGGVEPAPMVDASGVFVGVGGGYNSMTVNQDGATYWDGTTLHDLSSADTVHSNTLAPFGQVGYWGHLDQNWMWGVKAFYKYLNTAASGGFSYQAAVNQEAAGQLMAGMYWHGVLPYIAAGAVWLPTTVSYLDTTTGYENHHKGLWGGIFSLGMRKDLNQDWFVDTAYSYAFSEKYAPDTVTSGTVAHLNTNQRITVQSVDVSVNYKFAV